MIAMVQTLIPVPEQTDYQSKLVFQPAANAAINTVQQQMFEILQAMQATQIENANSGGNNGGSHGVVYANEGSSNEGNNGGNNIDNNNQRHQRNKRITDDATLERQVKSKYCHTHGASNHDLNDCNRRAPGHKNAETFTNRMGGSKAFSNPGNVEWRRETELVSNKLKIIVNDKHVN